MPVPCHRPAPGGLLDARIRSSHWRGPAARWGPRCRASAFSTADETRPADENSSPVLNSFPFEAPPRTGPRGAHREHDGRRNRVPAPDLGHPCVVTFVPRPTGTELALLRVTYKKNGARFAPASAPTHLKSKGRRNVDRRCRNLRTIGLPPAGGPDDPLFVEWICLAARRAERQRPLPAYLPMFGMWAHVGGVS